jgi:hypothetical protein
MKLRKLTSAALALAGTALLAQQAQALNSYTTGDLLLGFEQAGNANDYLVNIGLASEYIDAAPGKSFTVSAGNLEADLSSSSLFGSGWATDSTVQWAIAGTTGASGTLGLPASTVFLTEAEATPGVANAKPLAVSSVSTQGGYEIDELGTQGFQNSVPTGNADATIQTASGGDSFVTLYNDPNGEGFGSGDDLLTNSTPTTSILDLYELEPHNISRGQTEPDGTFLGDFSLDSDGDLIFTAAGTAETPEPSTYALMSVGLTLLFWQFRRKVS